MGNIEYIRDGFVPTANIPKAPSAHMPTIVYDDTDFRIPCSNFRKMFNYRPCLRLDRILSRIFDCIFEIRSVQKEHMPTSAG